MHWDRRRVKARLLRRTLRYAQQEIPFYRELLAGKSPYALELADFPLVDAARIRWDLESFMTLSRFPDFVLTTGGSTSQLSVIPGTIDEVEAACKFATGLRRCEYLDPNEFEGATIALEGLGHGLIPDVSHGQPTLRLLLYHCGHADLIRGFLETGIRVGGRCIPVIELTGALGKLKILTAYLMAEGFDASRTAVRRLTSYGSHLSELWKERIEKYWGATLRERYGLSEFFYDVPLRCAQCSRFHFSMLIQEFWSPSRHRPVDRGDTVLVLTSLSPFAKVLPRIRYWTGDLVRIGEPCEAAGGETGFDFLGRAHQCLVVATEQEYRAILTALDVRNVLDGIADSVRHDTEGQAFYAEAKRQRKSSISTGVPVYCLQSEPDNDGPRSVRLLVEVCFDPGADPLRTDRVKCEIADGLDARNPTFRDAAEAHGIVFDVDLLPEAGLSRR